MLARTRAFPCHAGRFIRWSPDATEGVRTCPDCKTKWAVSLARASTELEAAVGCEVYRIKWEKA